MDVRATWDVRAAGDVRAIGDVRTAWDVRAIGDVRAAGDVREIGDVRAAGDVREIGDVHAAGDVRGSRCMRRMPSVVCVRCVCGGRAAHAVRGRCLLADPRSSSLVNDSPHVATLGTCQMVQGTCQ